MFRKVVLSGASLASIPALISTVQAAEEKTQPAEKSMEKKLIMAKDLPLYGEPRTPRIEFVEGEPSQMEDYISVVRKGAWDFMDSIQGTTTWCKDKYEIGKAHTNDLVIYLREDSGAIPRAVFITVSGLGGIVAGYKGGAFRKLLFATAGMTTSAAICYPHQAIDISRQAWQKLPLPDLGFQNKSESNEGQPISQKIRDEVNKNLDKLKGSETDEKSASSAEKTKADSETTKPDAKESAKKDSKATEKTKDGKETTKKGSDSETPKVVKKDHGMSKEEDKDLYTTRGK